MTFVDSVVLIDALYGSPPRRAAALGLLRSERCAGSELLVAETLVLPLREGPAVTRAAEAVLDSVTLYPIDRRILRRAAELRAIIPGLKSPDAVHAATALVQGASEFVTRDTGFRRIPGLPLRHYAP